MEMAIREEATSFSASSPLEISMGRRGRGYKNSEEEELGLSGVIPIKCQSQGEDEDGRTWCVLLRVYFVFN